jgi:hypothetical protein
VSPRRSTRSDTKRTADYGLVDEDVSGLASVDSVWEVDVVLWRTRRCVLVEVLAFESCDVPSGAAPIEVPLEDFVSSVVVVVVLAALVEGAVVSSDGLELFVLRESLSAAPANAAVVNVQLNTTRLEAMSFRMVNSSVRRSA